MKNCLQCNKEFQKKPNESARYWITKRFCSPICARRHETIEKEKMAPEKTCDTCSKVFKKDLKLSKKQWKEKRLCSKKCVFANDERNRLISNFSTGNTYAKGTIAWNKGTKGLYKLSEKTKQKLSKLHKDRVKKGLCHLWKGGVTDLNRQLRGCKLMRDWKRSVLERDDFTCRECNIRGGRLNADHIKEFSLIRDENKIQTYTQAEKCSEMWDIENGQTLCVPCHNKKTALFLQSNWSNQFTRQTALI